MLAFLIPLKSKAVSNDWELTSSLLAQTLRSVANQDTPEHSITLVCHDLPSQKSGCALDTATIIHAGSAIPERGNASQMRDDKERKLALGLGAILRSGAPYVMKLDADDLVHHRLTTFVLKSEADAVVCRSGIVCSSGNPFWCLKEPLAFHKVCGSSTILRTSLFSRGDDDRDRIKKHFVSDNHETICETCGQLKLKIAFPPFPAACYIQSADLRLSEVYHHRRGLALRERLGLIRRTRVFTSATRKMFGLV